MAEHRQEDRPDHEVRDHRLRRHGARCSISIASTSGRHAVERAPGEGDENLTGEFGAVAAPQGSERSPDVPSTPSLGDLGDLASRSGGQTVTLVPATEAAQLAALRELASELPVSASERVVVERVLRVLAAIAAGPRTRGPRRSICATATRPRVRARR